MSEQEFPSEMPYEGSPLENKDLKRKLKEAMELLDDVLMTLDAQEQCDCYVEVAWDDVRRGSETCAYHQRYEALKKS